MKFSKILAASMLALSVLMVNCVDAFVEELPDKPEIEKNNFEKEDAEEKNISEENSDIRKIGDITFFLSNFNADQSEEELMSVLQEVYDNTGAIPVSAKGRIYFDREQVKEN